MSHKMRFLAQGFIVLVVPFFLFGLDFPKPKSSDEPAIQEFQKGWKHFNVGELSLAREHFYKSLAKKEDFHLAKFFLFQTHYKAGDWITARNILQELNQDKPNDVLQNRLEYLNLEISDQTKPIQERVYFTSIQGDENRGYRFRNPVDITTDSQGNLYILGYNTNNLVSFNPNLEPRWNTQGGFFQKMKGPISLFLNKDSIYVLDFIGDAIFQFSLEGKFLNKFGETGGKLGQFRGPSSLTQDTAGFFYVADSGNSRIQKFNPNWEPLFEFGNMGDAKLLLPVSVTWNGNKLYVADKSLNKIFVFDQEGNLVETIQSPNFKKIRTVRFIDNKMYVTCEINGVFIKNNTDSQWEPLPSFRDKNGIVRNIDRPFGITNDSYGYFYITDFSRHRVDIFTPKNYLMSNLNIDIDKIDVYSFPNIHIYFRVKNRHHQSIRGLTRDDFILYENDNLKKYFDLTDLKKYNNRQSLAILYENSEDLVAKNELIRDWLYPFFNNINYQDKILLIRSGENPTTLLDKTHSLYEISHRIRKSIPEKNINSGKSIYHTTMVLSRELGIKNIIYLASGNYPINTRQYNLSKIIYFAKVNGIRIYPILLSQSEEIAESWEQLAKGTNGRVFYLNQNSNQLYQDAIENIDLRYVISYKTEVLPELKGRWIPLELQVRYRKFGGKTSGGYFVP